MLILDRDAGGARQIRHKRNRGICILDHGGCECFNPISLHFRSIQQSRGVCDFTLFVIRPLHVANRDATGRKGIIGNVWFARRERMNQG